MASNETKANFVAGPVLFAYDGTELAQLAIEQAGCEVATDREAIVLCVWQPADVGFEPINKRHFDADAANEVQKAAEETAQFGVSLAVKAGFRARGMVVEAAPTWQGIIETAEANQVSLIVLGTHRHGGFLGHLHGSVAAAVVTHAECSVLVVHQRP